MCEMRKFFSIFFLITIRTQRHLYGANGENIKIWKPNNNILNRENQQIDSDINCERIEFGKINSEDIIVDKLQSKEFLLPISGSLVLLDDGYLEIQNGKSSKKSDCLKLKETKRNYFLDPNNWDCDNAKNFAVPDTEKIPCIYDKIKFPNGIYSGVNTNGVNYLHTVSSIEFGNETFDRITFAAFKTTDLGSSVFTDSGPVQLEISERKCYNPSGCKCNRDTSIRCSPKKTEIACLNPIQPIGFCSKICGAFLNFKPKPNFSLNRLKEVLKIYTNIHTHASKIKDDVIQVVFAEEKYTGDSIERAQEFFEKIQTESSEYGIARISKLYVSGSQTNGNSTWGVVFTSFFIVVVLFGIIFYITYGDLSYLNSFRFGLSNFMTSSSSPLSSTYRARFNPREDESGLIFDQNNSPNGSTIDLHRAFDNPMYGHVSTGPDLNDDIKETSSGGEAMVAQHQEEFQKNPLFDLSEIKEEIGTEFEELPDITQLNDVEKCRKDQENEE